MCYIFKLFCFISMNDINNDIIFSEDWRKLCKNVSQKFWKIYASLYDLIRAIVRVPLYSVLKVMVN